MKNTSPPFFLIGFQRSGTTMLRLMMNNHPRIAVPFESGFIPYFYKRLGAYGDLKIKKNRKKLLEDIAKYPLVKKGALIINFDNILSYPVSNYSDLIYAIFEEYQKVQEKHRWGDKTPSYITEIDIIWKLFPGCKIIHLVRDGRDVALSLSRIGWGSTIPRIADNWAKDTILAHKMGNLLGNNFLEIHYEDLVLSPEKNLKVISKFIRESYDGKMLEYHHYAKKKMPNESIKWHTNSVKKPDPSKIFKWKDDMSRADQIIFEQIAKEALRTFSYETIDIKSSWESRLKNIYYANFKRW